MGVRGPVRDFDAARSAQRLNEHLGREHPTRIGVVLARDERQTMGEIQRALTERARGVFLVAHRIGHQRLFAITREVIQHHSALFVGVRCLDLRPQDVFCRLPAGVRGVWTDSWPAELRDASGGGTLDPCRGAALVAQARRESRSDGLHFASVRPGRVERDLAWAEASGADVVVLDAPNIGESGAEEFFQSTQAAFRSRPVAYVLVSREGRQSRQPAPSLVTQWMVVASDPRQLRASLLSGTPP